MPVDRPRPHSTADFLRTDAYAHRPTRRSWKRAYMWRAAQAAARLWPHPCVEITRPVVVLPHLPRALDGLRILHLADTHLSAGSQPADVLPELLAGESFDL